MEGKSAARGGEHGMGVGKFLAPVLVVSKLIVVLIATSFSLLLISELVSGSLSLRTCFCQCFLPASVSLRINIL
jgi:hypothetical protein